MSTLYSCFGFFSNLGRYYLAGQTPKMPKGNRPTAQGLPQSSCKTNICRHVRRQLAMQILVLLHRMNHRCSAIHLNKPLCQLNPLSLGHHHRHHQATQNLYPMVVNVPVYPFHLYHFRPVRHPTPWRLVDFTRSSDLDP